MKSMWLETPEHRQMNGHALCDLILNQNVIAESVDTYIHEFSASDKDLLSFDFNVGSYLIVSTPKRYAIAAGRVISLQENTITLVLERCVLNKKYVDFDQKFNLRLSFVLIS